jgi:PAS domain S-box-containing protein
MSTEGPSLHDLEALFHDAPFAVAVFEGPEHVCVAMNAANERLIGGRDVIGKPIRVAFPQLAGGRIVDVMDRVYRTGNPERLGSIFAPRKLPDGRVEQRFLRAEWRARRDASGEIIGVYAFGVEVTEEVVGHDHLPWEHVFKDAAWGMSVSTPDNRFVEVNEAFARMHGSKPDDWVGRPVLDMFADESKPMFSELARQAHETGSIQYESLHVRSDGTKFPVLCEITAFKDDRGNVLFKAASYLDITARKADERRLAERTRLLDLSNDAIVVRDAEDRVTYWNRGAQELYGYSQEEALGRNIHELLQTEFPAPLDAIRQALLARDRWSGELVHRRRDGQRIVVSSRWALDRDARGRPASTLETNNDITSRKRAEEELRRAVHVRDEFLSVASHELRTPLTALTLQLEGIQKIVGAQRDGAERRIGRKLAVALRQTERLAALVEGLLDESRIASGGLRLELESFDLRDVVRDVTERLSELASRSNVDLRLELGTARVGTWDRACLEQICLNLLGNAIKYGAGAPVDVILEGDEHMVELRIIDRGIGISPSDQQRIFGRFERAVSTSHYGGFGLGLYIARQMVEAHGGAIEVVSAPGKGATFVVRLPRITRPGASEVVRLVPAESHA